MNEFLIEKLTGSQISIPISSICNQHCIFCSNDQNPFEIKRCGFIDFDTFKKELYYSRGFIKNSLSLSDTLPGRISEGEAFLHPQFKEIITYVRNYLPKDVEIRITTNGSMLNEDLIEFLEKNVPIRLSISIPSFNKENWMKCFNSKNENDYYNAVSCFNKFKKVKLIASVVPIMEYDDLENTIRNLSNLDEILIWYPGYTNFTSNKEYLNIIHNINFNELQNFFMKMSGKYKIQIKEPNMINEFNYNIEYLFEYSKNCNFNSILWLTSEAAYEKIKSQILNISNNFPEINNTIDFIKNRSYGGNINCAGLLLVKDICQSIENHKSHQLIILPPQIYLNRIGEDISGDSIFKLDNYNIKYLFAVKE